MGRRPPTLALWILRTTVPHDEVDAIAGDLVEWADAEGRGWWWFIRQAVLFALSFGWMAVRKGATAVGRVVSIREILKGEGLGMVGWWKDLKVSARGMLRRPGFSLIVIVTLGLGIGANTAIFSVVQGTLLWELPYPAPDRLVWHSDGYREWGGYGSSMSLANIVDLRDATSQVENLEAYRYTSANLSGDDRPQRVDGLAVGPDFLRVLGMSPALGRDLTREDNVDGAADVVLLTHELWREQFGGEVGIVGRSVLLDGAPFTVVGVLPEEFLFRAEPRFLVPIKYDGTTLGRRGRGYNAVGRLAPDATLEGAREEVQSIFARLEQEYPESNQGWQTWIQPLKEVMVGRSASGSLRILGGAVFMVLLIACVNVANLLLVRSESRHRELAVRVAMGAGRGRLLPVFLTESVVLSLAGGALGVLLAYWGVPLLVSLFGSALPRADAIGLNGGVLLFALALSLATGVAVGSLPALRVDVKTLQKHLKEGTRSVSRSGKRLRQGLVVVEIALSVVLVAGAGLLMRSFWRVANVDSGLEQPEQVLVARLSLSAGTYSESEAVVGFYRELLDALAQVPGVRAAGVTNRLPLHGGYNITDLFVNNDQERVSHFVELRYVTPGFFAATGIDLLAGRPLDPTDGEEGLNVVVTRELAVQLFGTPQAAVDQYVLPGGAENPRHIVGVVSDTRDMGLTRRPPPGMYYAFGPGALAGRAAVLLVRTDGDPVAVLPQLREAVERIDPTLPVYGSRVLSDLVEETLSGRRFSMSLLTLFGVLALVLGAVGIYGVMSYTVAERTREMGVRMALGARGNDVVRMVVRSGVQLTALGLVVGVVGSLAAGRLLADLLFEVAPTDLATHGAVVVLLAGIAVLASYVPARRASSVDPVVALRQE